MFDFDCVQLYGGNFPLKEVVRVLGVMTKWVNY